VTHDGDTNPQHNTPAKQLYTVVNVHARDRGTLQLLYTCMQTSSSLAAGSGTRWRFANAVHCELLRTSPTLLLAPST
jgi:hypothetical protein